MGFFLEGETLRWSELKEHARMIKDYGVEQFLAAYSANKCIRSRFLWGDEVEYMIVHMDDEKKEVALSLRAVELISELQGLEDGRGEHERTVLWRPEYAAYMIEGTPGRPFGSEWGEHKRLEENMMERRGQIKRVLGRGEYVVTMPSFPLLGCDGGVRGRKSVMEENSKSIYVSDEVTNSHKRFGTLTKNIRERRGCNVVINVPQYLDESTERMEYKELRECLGREAEDGCVYMDAMAFGMGMCCLQCTIQCVDIHEAGCVYDQLVVFAPVMMALTAGTVCQRGMLVDTDLRWNIIGASVDDRTAEERGLVEGSKGIPKSRYGSVDSFLYVRNLARDEEEARKVEAYYNDLEVLIDKDAHERILSAGVDSLLAQHIAHLFIRDPLVVYRHRMKGDASNNDHFECIQSTNWQTVRFKPPVLSQNLGWRVEFRPMEVQATDSENAAFVTFVILLVKTIIAFRLKFYIPISKIDRNIHTAHLRNAVLSQKFHWRRDVYDHLDSPSTAPAPLACDEALMSIDQIINGSPDHLGIISVMKRYLSTTDIDDSARRHILSKLDIVSKRASGQSETYATWQRKFITSHPKYQKNSVVTQEIAYDLVKAILSRTTP
ncbi:glutamate--cysteine ligase-like isoform X1 [Schistocerca gregaria]|uniref:glutamate--cysteine ligase-like isoform X1 n=1 Tax=Schistocerca gregaria TaxID=7010 RepID=UPI00211F32D5|nr:glutamate--cysteine ligase-like isoform X1 [Schistocerca gregaria]